jgi:DNA-binding SARP family transcriptional activator
LAAVRTVAIQLLGRFYVAIDGAPISGDTWRSRRARDAVKLLALAPAHRMHRTELMEALWPERDAEASGTNLRKALHFARQATGDERTIANDGGILVLWPDARVETDVERFRIAAQSAIEAKSQDLCRAAADLYAGDLLPDDLYESWSAEPRDRLRRLYLDVLHTGGMWARLAEEDPTDEEAARALMRAHLDAGERREAIRRFERLREALRDQLGVGPDQATVALYDEILAAEGAPQPSEAERTHALLAWALVHMNRGDMAEAERAAEEARAISIDAGLGRELGDAATILAKVAMAQGRWRARFAEELAESMRMRAQIERIVYDAHLCFAEYYLEGPDGYDAAAEYAHQVMDIAEKQGSATGVALALLMLGEAELFGGKLDVAERHLLDAAEANERDGWLSGAALARQRLAEAAVSRGRRYEANRLLGRAHSYALRSDIVSHLLVRVLGTMIQAAPDPEKATAVVRAAERELRHSKPCEPCSMGYLTNAAMASARAGELSRARSFVAEAERVAGMWQGGVWSGAVWEANGVIRQAAGEPEQARALFREAAEEFARAGHEADAARCRAAAEVAEVVAGPVAA